MRTLVGVAIVPAAPLLLPAVSPDQPSGTREAVGELRQATRRCLERLPPADVHVLVAAGPRGIHDGAEASLASLGLPDVATDLPVSDEVQEHLSRLTQYPVLRGDPLDVSHSVLALLVDGARNGGTVLPLSVPSGADFDVLVSVGAALAAAGRDAGVKLAVICAGDLSAGLEEHSPAAFVDGGRAWDQAVVALLQGGDLEGLRDLGPDEARRVHALGWAPLAVAHGACAAGRLEPSHLAYLAPRGVGQLVGLCLPADEGGPESGGTEEGTTTGGSRFTREQAGREGVVRRTGDPRG